MNPVESARCRLCAEQKRSDKLINLNDNDGARQDISFKLRRLNAGVDFCISVLPQTVCFVCLNTLDNAFQFVTGIDRAQDSLSEVLIKNEVKIEIRDECDSASSSADESILVTPDIPITLQPVKAEAADVKPSIKPVKKASTKSKVTRGFDDLPLSHRNLTWRDYSWLCTYCDTQFPTVGELRAHAMQTHEACNAYRCLDCRKRRLSLDKFLMHVKTHRRHLAFSCYICFKQFAALKDLRKHRFEHDTTSHKCRGCDTNFTTVEELDAHTKKYCKSYQIHFPIYQPMMQHTDGLTCLLCHKTFKFIGRLKFHMLTHTDQKRDHACDVCGKCFLHKQGLAVHMTSHSDARPHKCNVCNMTFKTDTALQFHISDIHNNMKPLACEHCGKRFSLLKRLNWHKLIHSDNFRHVCSYCNKGFHYKSSLTEHERQHTGVKPYTCDICQRNFTCWPNFNKHMKSQHGVNKSRKKVAVTSVETEEQSSNSLVDTNPSTVPMPPFNI